MLDYSFNINGKKIVNYFHLKKTDLKLYQVIFLVEHSD